jgi:hypothetical protein
VSDPIRRAFALATRHFGGADWQYIAAGHGDVNLMRTTSPLHARTWATVAEVEDWVAIRQANYPVIAGAKNSKVEIRAVEYRLIPIAVAADAPLMSVVVCSLVPRGGQGRPHADGPEEAGEYHLR